MLSLIIQKIRQSLRLDRAVRFVWQAAPGLTIASLVLVVIQGAQPLLALYLMKLIVDAVTFSLGASDTLAAFKHVALLIALAGAVALLNAFLQSIANIVKEAQSLAVSDCMYDLLHSKSIEVDLEYYEDPQYLDTLHRAQREGPSRPNQILNGLVQLGQSGVSLIAMVGLLFTLHWGMAALLFAVTVPGLLVRMKYSGEMFTWQRERTEAERKASYLNWMLTGEMHAKEVRLFGT
jgi:ATP-binding cassette subfamily B protein